ncbi:hypothetical protein AGOR_G00012510 [Albula goreensis]|uniref:Uncharacterized protein n=1 Tax=Albula goreensis TaxID=1534307 RepID=A0A8T3E9S2_9TELE|nr:hypothetical protein AGOR_G00012510 [Albula goreensis]
MLVTLCPNKSDELSQLRQLHQKPVGTTAGGVGGHVKIYIFYNSVDILSLGYYVNPFRLELARSALTCFKVKGLVRHRVIQPLSPFVVSLISLSPPCT